MRAYWVKCRAKTEMKPLKATAMKGIPSHYQRKATLPYKLCWELINRVGFLYILCLEIGREWKEYYPRRNSSRLYGAR